MQEIDSSRFINALKDTGCGYLSDLLKKNNCILSGSLLLQSYTDKYNELYSKINKTLELFYEEDLERYKHIKNTNIKGIDIYIHKNGLIELLNEFITNYGFGITNIKIHYPYQENYKYTFLLTHNAVLRIGLFNIEQNISINIISVKTGIQLTSIVKDFDLTFCRIWFDGDKVYSYDVNEIQEMRGSLNKQYYEYYCNNNLFILNRIQKYICRGFNITLPMCNELKSNEVLDIETFIIKDILNKLLLSIEDNKKNYIEDFFMNKLLENMLPIFKETYNNPYTKTMLLCYFLSHFNHFTFRELEHFMKENKLINNKKHFILILKKYRDDNKLNYKSIVEAIKEQKHTIEYYKKQSSYDNLKPDTEVLDKMIHKQHELLKMIKTITIYIKKQSTMKLLNITNYFTLKKRIPT